MLYDLKHACDCISYIIVHCRVPKTMNMCDWVNGIENNYDQNETNRKKCHMNIWSSNSNHLFTFMGLYQDQGCLLTMAHWGQVSWQLPLLPGPDHNYPLQLRVPADHIIYCNWPATFPACGTKTPLRNVGDNFKTIQHHVDIMVKYLLKHPITNGDNIYVYVPILFIIMISDTIQMTIFKLKSRVDILSNGMYEGLN